MILPIELVNALDTVLDAGYRYISLDLDKDDHDQLNEAMAVIMEWIEDQDV